MFASLPGGKIVENHHLLTAANKFIDDMRADETRSAGYQIAHRNRLQVGDSSHGNANEMNA